jgi:aspartyl-tRNA(Asn)/glutamyl-tRNA(Gln) amidotransferase subunit B
MPQFETVIGLEVHAELNTASKIYCSCKNAFSREPNTQICPVCMGLPGALPVLNKKVVDYAIRMGHALHCRIRSVSRQDRKNYFYPDLPKAYQISQAQFPLCENGFLEIEADGIQRRVGIARIHIEEDAGKLLHDSECTGTLVDFNRCGVPLIEIVTQPDLRSSSEAKTFLDAIKFILRYLNISDCRMQEGSIRCDVNVSVRPVGSTEYGTRCEMKNVNSFSAAVRGIAYEAQRQIAILEAGGIVEQETRRWDDAAGRSVPMRSKEDAHDYRYFPEPDLLSIVVDEARVRMLYESLPELPDARIRRYCREYGITREDAVQLAETPERAAYFDTCVMQAQCSARSICNWLLADAAKYTNDTGIPISDTCMTPQRLTALIAAVEEGQISNSAGKTVFQEVLRQDKEPAQLITALGLQQNSDSAALAQLIDTVLAANAKSAADYCRGKTNALGYLVGQCMKASGGTANPKLLREILIQKLE